MKTNYIAMMQEIQKLQSQLQAKQNELHKLPGYLFIDAVAKRLTWDLFSTPADLLVEELTQRDEPMLEREIRAVFQASGFEYAEHHIRLSNPDSQETVNEQLKHYRE